MGERDCSEECTSGTADLGNRLIQLVAPEYDDKVTKFSLSQELYIQSTSTLKFWYRNSQYLRRQRCCSNWEFRPMSRSSLFW